MLLPSDGSLWAVRKGAHDPERIAETLPVQEVGRAVEALLRPVGKSVNEATPSVDAKLPRVESLPGLRGGARVKILHGCIAPGRADYPSINIRLFEPLPVRPEKLVGWGVAPEQVIAGLLEMVARGARLLVIGGTASGKTTFLSAMTSAIPKSARVVKIEDPEEIWMEHPHVVTIEARRAPFGSTSVKDYSIKDGVDDAMRMSPHWLIVGEVRTGDAGAALFRAQMSDHPGLSTFHADSPESAVKRMALNMYMDAGIQMSGAKELFAMGVEVVAQVGWTAGKRTLVGVWEVESELRGGDVRFTPLYHAGDSQIIQMSRR
jgi:pilus assembly protein CpaF